MFLEARRRECSSPRQARVDFVYRGEIKDLSRNDRLMPKRFFLRIAAFAALPVIAIVVGASCADADDAVTQFYKGRQITLIIPAPVGGGYDLYARLLARHIGKYIPGSPNVVPSNMPGAAGVVAAQYLYASGPKDGTVFGEFYASAIMAPLLGDSSQVKYDPTKFNYLGSASTDVDICFVRADSPVKNFADALRQNVILGATGIGGASTDYPALYNNLLGANFKVIPGYPGVAEIGTALEKGEIEGTCGASWSIMTTGHPDWLRDGKMRVLVQENIASDPDLAKLGVPLSTSFAKTDEARQIMNFVFTQSDFERPFGMAPEVPAARVDAVRRAFAAAMQDPDLLAEAKTMHLEVDEPMTGGDLQATITRLMATPADIVQKAQKAVTLAR
jgi:tripartite-type tricarboxylate transporter receptor subunit TctC